VSKRTILSRLRRLIPKKKEQSLNGTKEQEYGFFSVGFHGDKYLLDLVAHVIGHCECFVETGTNVGSTVTYVARTFPEVLCISCEPNEQAAKRAVINSTGLTNVVIHNETSQQFLRRFEHEYRPLLLVSCLFWLDAHGQGFQWPLRDEVRFITSRFKLAYILIDDFKVPGADHFGFDAYRDQMCSYDYIKDALAPGVQYALYYPDYVERTSEHHPLRGWALIEFGHANCLSFPESIKIRREI
jgi:hypothetical protein